MNPRAPKKPKQDPQDATRQIAVPIGPEDRLNEAPVPFSDMDVDTKTYLISELDPRATAILTPMDPGDSPTGLHRTDLPDATQAVPVPVAGGAPNDLDRTQPLQLPDRTQVLPVVPPASAEPSPEVTMALSVTPTVAMPLPREEPLQATMAIPFPTAPSPAPLPVPAVPPQPVAPRARPWLMPALGGGALLAALVLTVGLWPSSPTPSPSAAVEPARKVVVPPSFEPLIARSDKGDTKAMRELGIWYFYGLGVRADMDEGRRWLKKAADAGDITAAAELKQIDAVKVQ